MHHFLLPAKEWGAVAAEKEAKALAPAEAKALGAWRKAITRSPSAAQVKRLQGLARRAEYLWGLVVRRLEISEREISRRIDVWGAEGGWLRSPEVAVPREKVKADLEAVDTPYWRLKTLMDAWCALWFWPVQQAGLLDGSHGSYVRAAEVTAQSAGWTVSAAPAPVPGQIRETYESEDLFGDVRVVEVRGKEARGGGRKEQIRGERRPVIALASLDDWLDFAESLLGTQDVAADSLVARFDTLDELEQYEDELPEWMGMERFYSLESRYPWAGVARDVAERQGFFHWELEFGQVFARGGYDLQVGNPPWVRPDWQEDAVLAELEPWFKLAQKPSPQEWRLRKEEALRRFDPTYFLDELATNAGVGESLTSAALYPLIMGSRPNLYRSFMCQVWRHANSRGASGLIHPDTHLEGSKDGRLRVEAYHHLRLHATFINSGNWAFEIGRTVPFGLHIYGGRAQSIDFYTLSQLHAAGTLPESLEHDGSGPPPAQKFGGTWDIRPHRSRVIRVTRDVLSSWKMLTAEQGAPVEETQLLHSISTHEQDAIASLARVKGRLADKNPFISSGYNETNAKNDGIIRHHVGQSADWAEVILQGTHFSIATPFAKQPNSPMRNGKDWAAWHLTELPENAIPRTTYAPASSRSVYEGAQDRWGDDRYTARYRLAWRAMIDPKNTERSLFAAIIPPGPAHTHGVLSMALAGNLATALNAGFWAALPLDYLLRVAGRANLLAGEAAKMPTPEPSHPLAHPLLLRTLRLNALTAEYAALWEELFHPSWPEHEEWAVPRWPGADPLAAHLTSAWHYGTPLRTEFERRAALVELDALVSVWLGITADQLATIYKSRYAVLADREAAMYFDSQGRRIAADAYAHGHGQVKQDYVDLMAHLESPKSTPPPEGYSAPFYKADREAEMRAAHAHFRARLDKEIAAGRWSREA